MLPTLGRRWCPWRGLKALPGSRGQSGQSGWVLPGFRTWVAAGFGARFPCITSVSGEVCKTAAERGRTFCVPCIVKASGCEMAHWLHSFCPLAHLPALPQLPRAGTWCSTTGGGRCLLWASGPVRRPHVAGICFPGRGVPPSWKGEIYLFLKMERSPCF